MAKWPRQQVCLAPWTTSGLVKARFGKHQDSSTCVRVQSNVVVMIHPRSPPAGTLDASHITPRTVLSAWLFPLLWSAYTWSPKISCPDPPFPPLLPHPVACKANKEGLSLCLLRTCYEKQVRRMLRLLLCSLSRGNGLYPSACLPLQFWDQKNPPVPTESSFTSTRPTSVHV